MRSIRMHTRARRASALRSVVAVAVAIALCGIAGGCGSSDDGKGGGVESTAFPCDVATIRAERGDDWGIIRVQQPLPDSVPILGHIDDALVVRLALESVRADLDAFMAWETCKV